MKHMHPFRPLKHCEFSVSPDEDINLCPLVMAVFSTNWWIYDTYLIK
jgi:hypothetical protein